MRILIVSAYGYWGKFDPARLFEPSNENVQIGGGETAMLSIANALAARKHEVIVFYNTDRPKRYQGVDYLPVDFYADIATTLEHDALVAWDATQAFRFNTLSSVRVAAWQLNDPTIGIMDWMVDLYMHPSAWHANRSATQCPELTQDKQRIYVTNGIDYGRYTRNVPDKSEKRVIYSSSPDRGLHHLLRIWPAVVAREPEASLHVFYDAERWLASDVKLRKEGIATITSDRAEILRQQFKNLPPNVFLHGGVNQFVLAEEQMRARVMAYPCDPVRPTEGFSMSILEGITAGNHVITTDADALKELWGDGPNVTILPLPIADDVWANTIVEKLRSEPAVQHYSPRYSWNTIAEAWEREIYSCLTEKRSQRGRPSPT